MRPVLTRLAVLVGFAAAVAAGSVVMPAAGPLHRPQPALRTTAPHLPPHATVPAVTPRPQVHATHSASRQPSHATPRPAPSPGQSPAPHTTYLPAYAYCGSRVTAAQRCIDAGRLTLYYPAGVATLAGHNYRGWAWLDDLPVGRRVVIRTGDLAGVYRVYGHGWAHRGSQGGVFPPAGYRAALALQTCTSTGTGFSFLHRI